MAYQGISPYIYQQNNLTNVQLIDDISSQFNGSTTTFTMTSGGDTFHAVASRSIFIVLGGIVQEPDVDYTTSGDQITFTTAPVAQLTFAGRKIYGLNKIDGINDGLVTPSKLSLGGPSWDNSGNTTISGYATVTGDITQSGDTNNIFINTETPTVRPTLDLNFERDQRLDSRITFTRDSVGTYVDANGLVQTAVNNIPRFDHDPITGESLGLLIEDTRTNLFTYSDLTSGASGSWWANGGTTVSAGSDVTAPDGTVSAWNTIYNGTSGDGNLYRGGGEVTTSNNTAYTCSVWAKVPSTNTYITGVRIRTFNDNHSGTFNLLTGTAVGTAEGTTANKIEAYPNGWYRCSITFTSGTDGDQGFQFYLINNSSTSLNSSAANGEELYLWGAQLEQGTFPTSYIPTSGSTVTRAADYAKITGTNFTDFYNQTEGTFYAKADTINPYYNTNLTGYDGNNNNYTVLGTGDSPHRFQLRFDDAYPYQVLGFGPNSTTAITSTTPTTTTTSMKIVGAVKQDYVRGYANGESILVDNGFDMISPSALYIGSLNGTSEINPGHIQRIMYYPRVLNNSQLQNLTK